MRRRLDLAASLVGNPEVIFLDEPTTGLDLRSRQAMWEVITGLVQSGVTIFLTTQYLEEADRLADRIACSTAAGSSPTAPRGAQAPGRRPAAGPRARRRRRVRRGRRASSARRVVHRDRRADDLGVATDGSAAHVRALLDEVDPAGPPCSRFAVHTATLDDVFLALTGHPAQPETGADDEPALGKEASHV